MLLLCQLNHDFQLKCMSTKTKSVGTPNLYDIDKQINTGRWF